MKRTINRLWVVYRMAIWGKRDTQPAVCTQAEWAELKGTGRHTLVRGRFTSEGEAEQFARSCQPQFAPEVKEPGASYVRLSDAIRG